jgi:hypothetical protein
MQNMVDACYWPTSGKGYFVTAGSQVMLLPDNYAPTLCKGTKLAVRREKPHFVEAKILNGSFLISDFRPVLNVVCILSGCSPAYGV